MTYRRHYDCYSGSQLCRAADVHSCCLLASAHRSCGADTPELCIKMRPLPWQGCRGALPAHCTWNFDAKTCSSVIACAYALAATAPWSVIGNTILSLAAASSGLERGGFGDNAEAFKDASLLDLQLSISIKLRSNQLSCPGVAGQLCLLLLQVAR